MRSAADAGLPAKRLRELFVALLVLGEQADASALFDEFWQIMGGGDFYVRAFSERAAAEILKWHVQQARHCPSRRAPTPP